MLTVHVRINDSTTGKPIPVRLRITDASGVYYPPLGRQARFRTGRAEDVGGQVVLDGKAFAYIDGICEVRLPPGPLTIEIARGPEYLSARREVVLAQGQISLRLTIERWTDERPAGWFSGDMRACDLSVHSAALEGAAEGLAVVQLLAHERPAAGETPAAASNLLSFSGAEAALRSPECLVAVNSLNGHRILGTVSLLNCHRPVFPLRFGEPGEMDNWSVADWCDQCHRKKGLVVWPDLPRLCETHPQGEALAALVLGKIDAFEVGPRIDAKGDALDLYYRLLACGLRPVLVGGSGKDSNAVPLGAVRTYAQWQSGQECSAANWIETVRSGRTFITSGPLLSLSVLTDGDDAPKGPGGAAVVTPGQRVHVRAEARCAAPIDRLELLAAGTVIAAAPRSAEERSIAVEAELRIEDSAWVVARCQAGRLFAHSSPVFLTLTDRPLRLDDQTLAPLLAALERTMNWVEREAACETDRQRQHLREVLLSARQELERRRG